MGKWKINAPNRWCGIKFPKRNIYKRKTSHELWNDLIDWWISVCPRLSDIMRLYKESSFTYEKFRDNAKNMEIHLQLSGIETANSIGKGERYHYPLKGMFEITESEYNKLSSRIILRMSIKAFSDTMGPNGLLPSPLPFGILPKFPCTLSVNAKQIEIFEAVKLARTEMETL